MWRLQGRNVGMLHLQKLFVQLNSCSGMTAKANPEESDLWPISSKGVSSLFFHSKHKPAAHLDLIPCHHTEGISQSTSRAEGALTPLAHFLYKGQKFSPCYIHQQHPCPSKSAAPQAGALCSEQGAELSLHCHAQHRLRAAALQVNFSLAKWWQGKGLFLPHRGECSALTLNTCPKYFHVLKISSEIRGYLTLPNCGVCSTQCITGKYLCD